MLNKVIRHQSVQVVVQRSRRPCCPKVLGAETCRAGRTWLGRLQVIHLQCGSTSYRAGLWLKPSETSLAVAAGMNFCCHYRECSEYAFRHEKTRFKLPPRFHAFVHILCIT